MRNAIASWPAWQRIWSDVGIPSAEKPLGTEAAEPKVVAGPREVRGGARLVRPVDRDRHGLGGRRQQRVDVGERRGEGALVLVARREGEQVVARRDGPAE